MTVILFFKTHIYLVHPEQKLKSFFHSPPTGGVGDIQGINTQVKSQGLAGKGSRAQLPARGFKKSERMTPKQRKILNKDEQKCEIKINHPEKKKTKQFRPH